MLWVAAAYEAALTDPRVLQLAGSPNLEDFVEVTAKVKNAFAAGDELALRLAAQDLAGWAPSLLRPLNPPVVVASRAAALRAILDFSVVPSGYRQDMPVGIIDLLAPHAEELAGQLEPDLPRFLRDGRPRRYLRHGM